MPDAPDQPIPSFTPGTPTAPANSVGSGVVGAPDPPDDMIPPPETGTPAVPAVAASVIINPSGSNNSILYTAVTAGSDGNYYSITYNEPTSDAEFRRQTRASRDNLAITISPGAEARMIISGSTSPAIDSILLYAGQVSGSDRWTSNGLSIADNNGVNEFTCLYLSGSAYLLEKRNAGGDVTYRAERAITFETSPVGLDFTPVTGTGVPTVAAGASSAAQVVAAVNNTSSVTEVVTAAASGDVTGAVAAVSQTYLSGGVNAVAEVVIPTAPIPAIPIFTPSAPDTPEGTTPAFTPGTPTAPARPVPNFTPSNPSAPAQPIP